MPGDIEIATAVAAYAARHLGCDDIEDVPDVLKRVLTDNADAEIHRRVLGQQTEAHRARAGAAEAECARLRVYTEELIRRNAMAHVAHIEALTERDAARREAALSAMERDTLRSLTDAMRADNDRLRAIVEGRTTGPTDAEIAAHERAGGRWRCALVHLRGGHDWMDDDDARAKVRLSAPGTWRWWALDATGRPCPWPTVTP